jgi:hypothetical protein
LKACGQRVQLRSIGQKSRLLDVVSTLQFFEFVIG